MPKPENDIRWKVVVVNHESGYYAAMAAFNLLGDALRYAAEYGTSPYFCATVVELEEAHA
jgi:hypothetical protein